MGLLAYRVDGTPVVSLDLSEEEWTACGQPGARQLVLPRSRLPALPMVSSQGHRFFAPPAGVVSPDTADHLALKAQAIWAARAAGWHATPEQCGLAPSGQTYHVDVLCVRPNGAAAVAIVLLEQSLMGIDYKFRHEVFAETGMRGLWFLFGGCGHPADSLPPSRDVPRFTCRRRQAGRGGDYLVLVDRQWITFPDFIAGALRGLLHFNDYTPRSRLLQVGLFRQKCAVCRGDFLRQAPEALARQGVEITEVCELLQQAAAGTAGICSRLELERNPLCLHLGNGCPHCGEPGEVAPLSRGRFLPHNHDGISPDAQLAITVASGVSQQTYWSWGARPRPDLIPPPGEVFLLDGESSDGERLGQLLAAIGGARW